jgi:transcriptional regulator with XRE-family HTH domain
MDENRDNDDTRRPGRAAALVARLKAAAREREAVDWKAEADSFRAFVAKGLRGGGWDLPTREAAIAREAREEASRLAVAQAVKEARSRAKKTQEHLAGEAEVSVRTVRRVEASGRASFENLRAICACLDIPIPVAEGEVQKPRVWVEALGFVVWLVAVAIYPVFSVGFYAKTPRRKAWAAALCAFGAAAIWYSACRGDPVVHVAQDDVGFMGASLMAKEARMLSQIGWAAIAAVAAGCVGGMLAGEAWRAKSAKPAVLLALACFLVLDAGAAPLLKAEMDVVADGAHAEGGLEAFLPMRDAVRRTAALPPGFDVRKQEMVESMPVMLRAMRLPVPDYMKDRDSYLKWLDEHDAAKAPADAGGDTADAPRRRD